jgi:hypothetical protein
MAAKRTWLYVLGLGLLSSQAGHLLAYQVRFGAVAQQLESTGAHAYFPVAVKTSLGVVAALVLAGLFTIGLARNLAGRLIRPDSAPQYLRLLAALYTVQLAIFAGQEAGEAVVAGLPTGSVADLLLWGTLGQLPVALVAAAGLRWLLVRLEAAVSVIRLALAVPAHPVLPVGAVITPRPAPALEPFCASVAGRSAAKRGPPSSLRLSFS